jgi:hypothetical protein
MVLRIRGSTVGSETARPIFLGFAAGLALLSMIAASGCVTGNSENPDDWIGPHSSDFRTDLAMCKDRRDSAGIRIRGDSRNILLDCMERKGWHPKEKP